MTAFLKANKTFFYLWTLNLRFSGCPINHKISAQTNELRMSCLLATSQKKCRIKRQANQKKLSKIMTSLPLIQKPTDIVSLLTLEENFKFTEILAETNIEDIPQLEESEKAIQKLEKISKQEKDYRIKLLQQRLYQLSVIQSFQIFEEDYKDYKAHFSINGRGISMKIVSPHGDSWEKQQTFRIDFGVSVAVSLNGRTRKDVYRHESGGDRPNGDRSPCGQIWFHRNSSVNGVTARGGSWKLRPLAATGLVVAELT
ncbi:MAG: hypothetical protein F6K28_53555 [Microcoleus sp. SIO2G3]|nr:hypothetical protein [Microcoleus sp. SIO2G3]